MAVESRGRVTGREPAATDPLPKLDCSVLVAEDGVDNQRLITFLLQKAGARVTLAQDGVEALEIVESGQTRDERYDVILMDMQMPRMDGYTATTRLREMGVTLPIVALTAHALEHDRQKCLDAGCTDYLSKPIQRRDLLHAVARYANPSAILAGSPNQEESASCRVAGWETPTS